ncbi:Ubiquitin-conjugating enzyme E2 T [Elasticomyces elasticus]|nr:Ubiquitin-conjugating enzyme E2 T [Elasticomyces elasticus]
MAEAVGLVLGGLGVVGAFSVCVQAFDMIQIGRTQDHRLKILATKLDNQKARFMIWGGALQLDDPTRYDRRVEHPFTKPQISASCQLIYDMFTQSDQFMKRYGLKAELQGSSSSVANQQQHTGNEASPWRTTFVRFHARFRQHTDSTTRDAMPPKSHVARWVIADQKAFSALTRDLREIIDDLESLTRNAIPGNEGERMAITTNEIESIDDRESVQILQEAAADENGTMSDAASIRLQSFVMTAQQRTDQMSLDGTFHTAPEAFMDPPNDLDDHELPEGDVGSLDVPQNRRVMTLVSSEKNRDGAGHAQFEITRGHSRVQFEILHQQNLDSWNTEAPVVLAKGFNRRLSVELREILGGLEKDFVSYALSSRTDTAVSILGSFLGFESTPYEAGIFHVLMLFGDGYPLEKPVVRFLTKVYHPNIDARGKICVDFLDDNWTPTLSIFTLLISLGLLLAQPRAEDPLVPEIAATLVSDPVGYDNYARQYTAKYAIYQLPPADQIQAAAESMAAEKKGR